MVPGTGDGGRTWYREGERGKKDEKKGGCTESGDTQRCMSGVRGSAVESGDRRTSRRWMVAMYVPQTVEWVLGW